MEKFSLNILFGRVYVAVVDIANRDKCNARNDNEIGMF